MDNIYAEAHDRVYDRAMAPDVIRVEKLPQPHEIPDNREWTSGWMDGGQTHLTLVRGSHVRRYRVFENGHPKVAQTEIARVMLEIIMEGGTGRNTRAFLSRGAGEWERRWGGVTAAEYVRKGTYEDMAYIDISRAHHNIGKYASLLTTVWPVAHSVSPHFMLYRMMELDDCPEEYLPQIKFACNAMYGFCINERFRPTMGYGYINEQWADKMFGNPDFRPGTPNKYYSPGLTGWLRQALHSIASEALDRGAVYVKTDGYFMPASQKEGFLDYLHAEWALDAAVKRTGVAHVFGLGWHQIDGEVTGNLVNSQGEIPDMDDVDKVVYINQEERKGYAEQRRAMIARYMAHTK